MAVGVYKKQSSGGGGLGGLMNIAGSVKGMFGGGGEKAAGATSGGGSDAMGQAGEVMSWMNALKSPAQKFQAIGSGVHMAKPSQASAFPLIGKVVGTYFGGGAGGAVGGKIGNALQDQVNGEDLQAVQTSDGAMSRRMTALQEPEEEQVPFAPEMDQQPNYFNRLRQLGGR